MVRPIRLAKPWSSTKRYQYSRLGLISVTRKRHVQSDSALISAVPPVRIFLKSGVVDISTINFLVKLSCTGGRLVHKITLSAVGSPDATPCGKRSRRSIAGVGSLFPQLLFVIMAKPMNKDCKKLRRVKYMRFLIILLFYSEFLFRYVQNNLKSLPNLYLLAYNVRAFCCADIMCSFSPN